MALLLRAPAKVNLDLRILGRREDGYHELETVFHSLDLHDLVYARLVPRGLRLDLRSEAETGMTVTAGEDNLVMRAAKSFLVASGSDRGLHFYLHKHVPAGAGLGGGSSDAAAALILANELHARPLSLRELEGIALTLGADVPYFLSAGTQIGTGLGEVLRPVPNPGRAEFVLILPPFGCSTVAVYKNHKPNLNTDLPSPRMGCSEVGSMLGKAIAGELGNDLELSAMDLYPQLAEIHQSVATMGFPSVRMSGSGSTLFLVFCAKTRSGEEQALAALRALAPLGGGGVRFLHTQTASEAVATRIPTQVDWPLDDLEDI